MLDAWKFNWNWTVEHQAHCHLYVFEEYAMPTTSIKCRSYADIFMWFIFRLIERNTLRAQLFSVVFSRTHLKCTNGILAIVTFANQKQYDLKEEKKSDHFKHRCHRAASRVRRSDEELLEFLSIRTSGSNLSEIVCDERVIRVNDLPSCFCYIDSFGPIHRNLCALNAVFCFCLCPFFGVFFYFHESKF